MSHTCHARGCTNHVPPSMLMCRAHWAKVPASVQRAVYSTYRRGQCNDMRPSREWHEAASAAIGFVAVLEERKFSVNEARAMAAHGVAEQRVIDGLAIIEARRVEDAKVKP